MLQVLNNELTMLLKQLVLWNRFLTMVDRQEFDLSTVSRRAWILGIQGGCTVIISCKSKRDVHWKSVTGMLLASSNHVHLSAWLLFSSSVETALPEWLQTQFTNKKQADWSAHNKRVENSYLIFSNCLVAALDSPEWRSGSLYNSCSGAAWRKHFLCQTGPQSILKLTTGCRDGGSLT